MTWKLQAIYRHAGTLTISGQIASVFSGNVGKPQGKQSASRRGIRATPRLEFPPENQTRAHESSAGPASMAIAKARPHGLEPAANSNPRKAARRGRSAIEQRETIETMVPAGWNSRTLKIGGADRDRTCDPHNAIVVLYQLSYDPNQIEANFRERRPIVKINSRGPERRREKVLPFRTALRYSSPHGISTES